MKFQLNGSYKAENLDQLKNFLTEIKNEYSITSLYVNQKQLICNFAIIKEVVIINEIIDFVFILNEKYNNCIEN